MTATWADTGDQCRQFENQLADARVTTTFSPYDGMNRVTGKSYNDGITPAVGYAYYPPSTAGGCAMLSQGRLTSVTSGGMVNNYLCYDAMGRVTSSSQKTGAVTYPSFSYAYDKSGALASITYPSGRVVTNTFDVAGRINQVSMPSKNYAWQVAYAPQGAIQSLSMGNGVAETWGFNTTRQQPTSLQASLGATALLNLSWGYGADSTNNGNVLSQTIARLGLPASVSQTYQYNDPSNRLSFAIEPNLPNSGGWWQAYSYDAYGNRAVPPGYDVPNPDQTPAALTEFTLNRWKRGAGDSYDSSGNQTGVATRANTSVSANVFTYDGENRMVSSNVASMGQVTYSYDGEGRRVQKSWACGGSTCSTVFVYDAMGQLAAEYSTAPNPLAGTNEYLTADSLGSTRLVTDGSGNVTQCYDYLPFGEEIRQGVNGRGSCYPPTGVYPHSADATSMKFTGKERDVETGLDYFGARYFSGAQGRFVSTDPITTMKLGDPQRWNKYAYARNSPLQIIDPTGRYNTDCKSTDISKCSADIQAFEARRQRDLKSDDARVRKAAGAYGSFNDGNNIRLEFDSKMTDGLTTQDRDARGNPKDSFTVTLPTSAVGNLIAHEGSHLADMLAGMSGAKPLTTFESEIKAFQTQAATMLDEPTARRFNPGFQMNFGDTGPKMTLYVPWNDLVDSVNRESIKAFLAANPTYGLTEEKQGGPIYVKPGK